MSAPIGFVLVTHTQPEQVAYLCRKLSCAFADPPIAIHHDFSKCKLDPATLPSNVHVVKDWTITAWGKASLLTAYLSALRLLHRTASPDWTASLSGTDYPIKSAGRILNDLRQASADALLDFRDVSRGSVPPHDARSVVSLHRGAKWMNSANERYVGFDILPFRIRKHIGMPNRTLYVRNRLTTHFFTPFSTTFRPFAGDAWHTLNRRAAQVLLAEDERMHALLRYYKRRAIPDESFYHTVLLNRPDLRVENDNRRYTFWLEGAPSPRLIEKSDIPAMVRSNAHFARKFPYDPELYAAVDEYVLQADDPQ